MFVDGVVSFNACTCALSVALLNCVSYDCSSSNTVFVCEGAATKKLPWQPKCTHTCKCQIATSGYLLYMYLYVNATWIFSWFQPLLKKVAVLLSSAMATHCLLVTRMICHWFRNWPVRLEGFGIPESNWWYIYIHCMYSLMLDMFVCVCVCACVCVWVCEDAQTRILHFLIFK